MGAASKIAGTSLTRRILGALVAATFLAACGSSTGSTSPAATVVDTPTAAATPTLAPTSTAAAPTDNTGASSEPTGVPTSIDPGTIVTASDASALAGTTFGPCVSSTTEGNGKICTYSSAGNVMTVVIGVAPDQATAQASEQAMKTQLEQGVPGVNMQLTELPGFQPGVDAAIESGSATIAGQSFSATAMFMLKGTTFLGVSHIVVGTGQAMTSDAIKAAAPTFLARLP